MNDFINLIPQEEKQEQVKTEIVKVSTVLTIILAIVTALASAFFFYKVTSLKQQSADLDDSIARDRSDIQQLSHIEIGARNLETRYKLLTKIFSSRVYYSDLLDQMKARIPSSIQIFSFNVQPGNKIAINGTGDSYLAIADFINKITEAEDLFTDVSLNSVNLENASNRAGFFIVITYKPEALQKEN